MRRTLLLGSVAVAASAFLVGCGGSDGDSNTNLNTASRIVVGYVYVLQNNTPQGTPQVIVSSSSTPPAGYVAPTAGTVTLSVPDGSITRAPDSETFNLATSNAVIARIVSRSAATPQFTMAFSGIQLNGETKTAPSATTINISGADETVFPVTIGAPSYTPGAPASMRVLIRDNSTLYGGDEGGRFGAPADVIGTASGDAGLVPSTNVGDRYEVAVILLDANGVVIPGTTFNVADSSPDTDTENAVTQPSSSLLAVSGGGVEGEDVTLTFTSPQAPGLSLQYTTQYSYGSTSNFLATFNPAGTTSLIWPESGPANTVNMNFTLSNGRGVVVPNRAVNLRTRDTSGVVRGSANYPAPASGPLLEDVTNNTDTNGVGVAVFQTPLGASGNAAFNGLNIKYGSGNLVEVVIGSSVLGSRSVIVNRPLNNLNIQGASRLDVGTISRTTGSNSYAVVNATDIDTQVIAAPTGTYNWTLTANSASTYGDLDNVSPRSIASPSIIGSSTGSAIQIGAGTNAGSFTVQAAFSGVTSNVLSTSVFGPPSKVTVSPAPQGAGGLSGAAGSNQTLTLTFLDGFGNNVTSETTITAKSGSLASSPGGSFTFPSAPDRTYNLTFPTAAGTYPANMSVTLNWTGTGQGTNVGSATGLNINRLLNIIVP